MPADRGPCFYCGNPTAPASELKEQYRGRSRAVPRNMASSSDHIYPRSSIRGILPGVDKDWKWHLNNQVLSCQSCNSYKGQLHPLDWLVIMPNNHNAARLAERLVELGEDMKAVFSAMQRRKK